MQHLPQSVGLFGLLLIPALSTAAFAQGGHPATQPNAMPNEMPMMDQMAELRANVARLEASLQQNHQGPSARGDAASNHPGMNSPMGMNGMDKPMGMNKGEMGMGGMGMGKAKAKGMKMMGMMKGAGDPQGMAMNSDLPGFPGVSHLYHVGASGFFLDHDEHLQLTPDQESALGNLKQKSLLAQNTADRDLEEAEQQLWELTAAQKPRAALIEKKIREIEKLRGDRRLGFIRAVGEAAKVLSADQRKALLGQEPQPPVKDAAQHQH